MKKCPFCGEDIQETSVKCMHCEELLPKSWQYSINKDQEKPMAKSIDTVTKPPSKQAAPFSPSQTMTASQVVAKSPPLSAKTVACTNPACSQKYKIAADKLGKKARCSKCNTVFIATEYEEEPEILTLEDTYEATVNVSQNQEIKLPPAKAIVRNSEILNPKKSTPQQMETASLPTRWLSFYNYGLLPFWTVMALIMSVGFFQYNFIFPVYVALLIILIYGLHKRFFWAWQCNWIVLSTIAFAPGFSKISLLAYIVATLLKITLFWGLFYLYFTKRRSLFSYKLSALKSNSLVALYSLFFLFATTNNIYSIATNKYVGVLDVLKSDTFSTKTASSSNIKPQNDIHQTAEPATKQSGYQEVQSSPAQTQFSIKKLTEDGRFVLVEEGIIKDTVTGLMWEQRGGVQEMIWNDANAYTRALSLGGYNDWRLPSKDECEELLRYAKNKNIVRNMESFYERNGFINTVSSYWSATINSNKASYAWVVSFYSGFMMDSDMRNSYNVRAVRNGKALAAAPTAVPSLAPTADIKPAANSPDNFVVQVNGEKLTTAEMEAMLEGQMASISKQVPPEQMEQVKGQLEQMKGKWRQQLLDYFIQKTLLTQEADRQKVVVTDDAVNAQLKEYEQQVPSGTKLNDMLKEQGVTIQKLRADIKNILKGKKLMESQVAPGPVPTDAEIKNYFDLNKSKFDQTEKVHEHMNAKPKALDEVKPDIIKILQDQNKQQAIKNYIEGLKNKATIVYGR